jgi:hypothetical protein
LSEHELQPQESVPALQPHEAAPALELPEADLTPVTPVVEAWTPAPMPSGPVVVEPPPDALEAWKRMGRELLAGVQTLFSAGVYAILIVTFGFQVARVDGLSMAPTLEDHDRLIVNKLVYEIGEPSFSRATTS